MAIFEDKFKVQSEDFAQKIPAYDYYGKVRAIPFEYNLSAALTDGDQIVGVELPVNAKIIDAYLKSPSMGATGIFSLGIKDEDGSNIDGLIESADAGGQAVLERAGANSDLIGTLLTKKSNLLLEVLETTIATSGKIEGMVLISVE